MESKEEKLNRLRKEREDKINEKHHPEMDEKYRIDSNGSLVGYDMLSKYGEKFSMRANGNYHIEDKILFESMPVKITKPDKTFRKGHIEKIRFENKEPVITVVCGKNKLKFDKKFNEVFPDDSLENFIKLENIEVPERLKKMSTENLLLEFRRFKSEFNGQFRDGYGIEGDVYRKELMTREHFGATNSKKMRKEKAKI